MFRRMLESATAEMLPYVAIAAFTGARRSEILRMTWKDVWSIQGFWNWNPPRLKQNAED